MMEQTNNPPDDLNLTEAAEAAAEELVERDMADLTTRISELESKLLRAAADYQNYVRRAQQNVSAAREQQTMDVARDLLTVLDHFDTALAVDIEKTSARSLLDGLVIVRNELLRTLERYGVKRITADVGQEFDPNHHEALMRQKLPNVKSGHITQQLQVGYTIGPRTLRPVKVAVAE